MARTTAGAVKAVLMKDYESVDEPSLTPFIETAGLVVDWVAECAADRDVTLSTERKELMERWLAAHYYAVSDKPHANVSTAGAGGTFQGQTGKYLEFTGYGQMAITLDPSGCIAGMAAGVRYERGLDWLGKTPSEQLTYEERD